MLHPGPGMTGEYIVYAVLHTVYAVLSMCVLYKNRMRFIKPTYEVQNLIISQVTATVEPLY